MKDQQTEIIVKVPFSAFYDNTNGVGGRRTSFISSNGNTYNFLDGKFVSEYDVEEYDFRQHKDDKFDDFQEVKSGLLELPEGCLPRLHYHSSNARQIIGEADVEFSHKPSAEEINKMSNKISKVISACMTLYGRDCFKKDRDISKEEYNSSEIFKDRKAKNKTESEYFVKRIFESYLPMVKKIQPEFIVEKPFVEKAELENGEFKFQRAYGGFESKLYSLPEFYINEQAEREYKEWIDIFKACFYEEFVDKHNVRELKKQNVEIIGSECVADNITGKEKASKKGGADFISGERLTIIYSAEVSVIKASSDIGSVNFEFVKADPEFINDAIKAGITLFGKSFLNQTNKEQREAFINTFISSYNKNESLVVEDCLMNSEEETYHIDVKNLDIKKVLVTEFVQKVLPNSVGKVYANSTPDNLVSENYFEEKFGGAENFFERVYGSTSEMADVKRLNVNKVQLGEE